MLRGRSAAAPRDLPNHRQDLGPWPLAPCHWPLFNGPWHLACGAWTLTIWPSAPGPFRPSIAALRSSPLAFEPLPFSLTLAPRAFRLWPLALGPWCVVLDTSRRFAGRYAARSLASRKLGSSLFALGSSPLAGALRYSLWARRNSSLDRGCSSLDASSS